jgi:pyrroloquinoline-quinone synthase
VDREDVRQAELLPATKASVTRLKAITQREDYRQGLAALYAYESQIPEVARTKREGLKSFYQITDERAVSFFRVHESIDLLHQDVALRTLSNECDTDSAQSAAIAAASEGAKALWGFLDGVAAAYLPEAADCHLATA